MDAPLRIGLVGYGLSGSVFHAPLYRAAGVELVAVASSDADKVRADHPRVRVHPSPEALFADADVELAVLATPTPTHAPLMLAAIAAGKHVLSDKPFCATLEEADAVVAAADAAGRVVSCYQNRRHDADFLTLRRLIEDGVLGEIVRYEAWFDRFSPAVRDRWQERDAPGVGIHYDLGAHLVDQALLLFGRPDWVQGDLQRLRAGADPRSGIVDAFHVRMARGATRIELSASMSVPDHRLRYRVQGTRGAWFKEHLDPQESQLRHEGLAADDARYGVEPETHHGTLTTIEDGRPSSRRVATERGDWPRFYRELAAAVREGRPPPVTAREARETIRVIEAIALSSATGRRVVPEGD